MNHFKVIAFDADDTLWHNERLYQQIEARYVKILSAYMDTAHIGESLYRMETRNIPHFGYGVKSFSLSMIETAVELTDGRISGQDILQIIGMAKEMLSAKVELLEHVTEIVSELAKKYPLMVITKGDLLDQEAKLARSGLQEYFTYFDVVSDKTRESYKKLLKRESIEPRRFLMVGNSIRSDILPILELGGNAVYVPYHTTWAHEAAEMPEGNHTGFYQIDRIGLLPALLEKLETSNGK
jgi:putative hydrolase of the HAD superfamily